MLMDNFLLFEPTAGTAVTTGGASTNVIDLLNARDIGIGDDPAVKLLVLAVVSFASGSTSQINVQFQGAPGSGSGGTWSTYAESGQVGTANLGSGTEIWNVEVPSLLARANNQVSFGTATLSMPRVLRLNYSIGTTSFSAGSITAGLVLDRDDIISYPGGVTITN